MLQVTEMACNSGEDARGRIELVSVDQGEDAVTVTLGVRPRDPESATCQSNPATSFEVTLDAPLGDRALYDGSRWPAPALSAEP